MAGATSEQLGQSNRPAPRFSERIADRIGLRPSAGTDEPYLDGLRACAVIMVVVVHAYYNAGKPAIEIFGHNFGFVPLMASYGVSLFFILSGFLLARPWFRAELTGTPRPSLRRFYTRRFLRVAPAYYVSIAVILVVFVPHPVAADNIQGALGFVNIGSHLLFVHQFVPVATGNFSGVGGVYWTLTMEMLFYLVLPFAVRCFTGRRWMVALPVAAGISSLWIYVSQQRLHGLVDWLVHSITAHDAAIQNIPATVGQMRTALQLLFPTWTFTFAVGIALARLVVVQEQRVARGARMRQSWWTSPRLALTAIVLGGVGVFYSMLVVGRTVLLLSTMSMSVAIFQFLLAAASLGAIVFGFTFAPAFARRPLGALPLRYIGWVSYGIYLFHVPVIVWLQVHHTLDGYSPMRVFVYGIVILLVVSTILGTASWLLIERPLLVWRPGWGRNAIAAGVAVATACVVVVVIVGARVPGQPDLRLASTGPPAATPLVNAPVAGVSLVPKLTGDATLADAARRGVIYGTDKNLLAACAIGAPPTAGTTLVMAGEHWSVSATAFSCRDPQTAADVVAQLAAWERSDASVELPPGRTGLPPGTSFYSDKPPSTPGFPAHFHIRYVSGNHVVGLMMQATSEAAGARGMSDLVRAVAPQYPPG